MSFKVVKGEQKPIRIKTKNWNTKLELIKILILYVCMFYIFLASFTCYLIIDKISHVVPDPKYYGMLHLTVIISYKLTWNTSWIKLLSNHGKFLKKLFRTSFIDITINDNGFEENIIYQYLQNMLSSQAIKWDKVYVNLYNYYVSVIKK